MPLFTAPKSVCTYPSPQWTKQQLRSVEDAIKRAWSRLQGNGTLKTGSEEEINNLVCQGIDEVRRNECVIGFTPAVFEAPVRGAKFENYKGEHIEKAPDLTIRRIDIAPGLAYPHFDALFIECKLIASGKTPLLYIREGILRFVVGDYAWAMSHALMLGYVRDGKGLPDALLQSFRRNCQNEKVKECLPQGEGCRQESNDLADIYQTIHIRKWRHPEFGPPGEIEITHLWLRVEKE